MRMLRMFIVFILFVVICIGCTPDVQKRQKEQKLIKEEPVTVNVFMENTGSMFGYYSRGNNFEKSIAALITNIQVSEFAKEVKFNYINSNVFPSKEKSTSVFLRKMNMPEVCQQKGDLSVTSIAAMLDTVLSKTGNNDMSIFVSDCVVSPGDETNAVNVLSAEENYIAGTFSSVLKKRDLAVVVYRLESDFVGNYYDCSNKAHYQNSGNRPCFIWLVGDKNIIKRYKKKVHYNKLAKEMSIRNSCEFYRVKRTPKYKIIGGDGSYQVSENGRYISGAAIDNKTKKLNINIYVDYKDLLSNNAYLCRPEHYTISNPNYKIKVVKDPKAGYTHIIRLTTEKRPLTATTVTLTLNNQLPQWIDDYSTEDVSNVYQYQNKTFGFNYIMKALQKAYNYNDKPYATIKVGVNTPVK